MFKIKRRLLNEQAKVKNRDVLIEDLENKIKQLKDENKYLRSELEEEHLENCNQRRKIVKILQLLDKPFGTFRSLLSFRNKVKDVLSNDYQSK